MKIIKKILKVVVIIVLSLIVIFNLYNFINLRILNKDISVLNGYSFLEVVSGSMEPTIKVGDLIVINVNDKDYKKNDIVTFYDVNGSFVTHRIVNIDKDKVITKGDANDSVDEAISAKSIIGKYKYKIPFIGMLLASIRNPIALIFILIVGILVCYLLSIDKEGNIIDDSVDIIEDKKPKNRKNTKGNKKKTASKNKKKKGR